MPLKLPESDTLSQNIAKTNNSIVWEQENYGYKQNRQNGLWSPIPGEENHSLMVTYPWGGEP
jgi:hypothetical protein